MKLAIAIKGPNGIYSFVFFFFISNNTILNIAPIKNDKIDIAIMLLHPKKQT